MKKCLKCLKIKEDREFYSYSPTRCKDCKIKYATKYKIIHPEPDIIYRFKNRDRINEYSRQWYLKRGKELRAKKNT